MREKLFSFGGCVYRMQVDGRHAAGLAALAAITAGGSIRLAEIDYMHTSNLPQGRALWLRRQMTEGKGKLAWSISCDGDTTFEAGQLLHELPRVTGQVAMGIAPVRIGGTSTLCNINVSETDEQVSRKDFEHAAPDFGRRAFADDLKKCLDGDRLIASGGFGLVVFNLEWFRQCWPEPAPEHVSIDSGEDIEFCRSVRARGGLINVLAVKTDHFAFGEKQTR